MRITLDNQEFELNINEAKRLKLLAPVITHKIGQRYKISGDDYLLVQANVSPRSACLVSLETGELWSNAVKVKDSHKISDEEFNKIVADFSFQLIIP